MYIKLTIKKLKKAVSMVSDKKTYKKLLIILIFFELIFVYELMLNTNEVYADVEYVSKVDEEAADPEDLKNAINSAPRGLDISDPTFLRGDFSNEGSSENMNSSKVIRKGTTDKTGILRVTHGFNQLGSIWSNIDKSNFLDISQDQSMSMWLYFGRPIDQSKPLEVGDGMAFVLQNAQDNPLAMNKWGGIKAISRFHGNPAPGETLGVWGADFDNANSIFNIPISQTAIPNSFAIEFDTFLNRLTLANDINGKGVSFDADLAFGRNDDGSMKYTQQIKGQHISMDYPDGPSYDDFDFDGPNDDATYVLGTGSGNIGTRAFFKMNHKNLEDNLNLTNSKWHHMTVKFDHSTSSLTYIFDDKDINGNMLNSNTTKTQKLKMSHFKLGDSNKLRWGFTGSTGRFSENNLIVFESIPSFVNADSSVSLKDTTKGNTIPGNDNKVNVGDELDFIYDLNYKNGSKEWSEILASMNLPKEVTFVNGTITYDNNPDYRENISSNEFKNGKVEHLLQKSLSNENNHAKIELHTTVNNQTEQIDVGKQHAHFASDNFIVDDDTPPFTITIPEMSLTTDPSGTINYKSMDLTPEKTPIKGTVRYFSGKNISPSNVTVHYNVNNKDYESFKLSGSLSDKALFDLDILKTQLILGNNTVKIYAEDSFGKRTSPSLINIFIGGGLEFGTVSKDVAFDTVKGGYAGQLVPRKGEWQLEVVDGRIGKNSWTLQASASPLEKEVSGKPTGEVFKGEIVYKNIMGKILPLKNLTGIYANSKDSDSKQTINVTNEWNSKLGMFLKVNDNNNSSGTYTGKITWSLIDGIG